MGIAAVPVGIPRAAHAQPTDGIVEIEGRLTAVSAPPGFGCGFVAWAITARFEVVRTLSGTPPGPVVFVLYECAAPTTPVGTVDRLVLGDRSRLGWSIIDDFQGQLGPRLWRRHER